MNGFIKRPIENPPFFKRLFGLNHGVNFAIEVENLLADAQTPQEINQEKLDGLYQFYKLRAGGRKAKGLLKHLYAQFIEHCLTDNILSDDEKNELQFLKLLIGLKDKEAHEILEDTVLKVFKVRLNQKLDDKSLSKKEFELLEEMKRQAGLDAEKARKVAVEIGSKRLQDFASEIVSNKRVSPEEDALLHQLADAMRIDLKFDEENKAYFDFLRKLWQLENGDLEEQPTNFRLQLNEVCYFEGTFTQWYEYRKVTKRVNYAGPTARIKLAKGVYYRMGSLGVKPVSTDELTLIDSGILLITSKRVLFVGDKGNKQILFNRILQVNTYDNGIDIQKDAGRSPFISIDGLHKAEMASIILNRLLDEYY
jgi:hypothetical protein